MARGARDASARSSRFGSASVSGARGSRADGISSSAAIPSVSARSQDSTSRTAIRKTRLSGKVRRPFQLLISATGHAAVSRSVSTSTGTPLAMPQKLASLLRRYPLPPFRSGSVIAKPDSSASRSPTISLSSSSVARNMLLPHPKLLRVRGTRLRKHNLSNRQTVTNRERFIFIDRPDAAPFFP